MEPVYSERVGQILVSPLPNTILVVLLIYIFYRVYCMKLVFLQVFLYLSTAIIVISNIIQYIEKSISIDISTSLLLANLYAFVIFTAAKALFSGEHVMTRTSVISEIKTPLTFFALSILVTEGILAALVTKAEGTNLTLLIIGFIVNLLALTILVFISSRNAKEEEFTNIFVGIVEEYTSTVNEILAQPTNAQPDDLLIGQCSGLVSVSESFRRFSITLNNLLNGQVDDLKGYLDQLRRRENNIQLSNLDRQRLNAILIGIKTALPTKIREAELEEARNRSLLRERRERRTR